MLVSKKLGVKKSVAEVENIDYIDLAENIGIGTLVNTKLIAASHIYRYTMNVDVKHLKFLTFSEAEVFEVTAEPGSKITRKTLADMNFPENATVGGVIRNGDAIIAKGDVQIEAGDKVVIFALPSAVKKVIKLFQKMINFRFITNIIGKLLFVESAFLILCIIVALIYGENDLMAFVYSVIITLGVGSLMTFTVKVKDRVLAKKDGYFIVTCTWIIFTIFGCLPYLFGGTIPSVVDAIFETMSGFTTTGSSVINNVEAFTTCHSILALPNSMDGRYGYHRVTFSYHPRLGNRGT